MAKAAYAAENPRSEGELRLRVPSPRTVRRLSAKRPSVNFRPRPRAEPPTPYLYYTTPAAALSSFFQRFSSLRFCRFQTQPVFKFVFSPVSSAAGFQACVFAGGCRYFFAVPAPVPVVFPEVKKKVRPPGKKSCGKGAFFACQNARDII
jgi:hypothetical protein